MACWRHAPHRFRHARLYMPTVHLELAIGRGEVHGKTSVSTGERACGVDLVPAEFGCAQHRMRDVSWRGKTLQQFGVAIKLSCRHGSSVFSFPSSWTLVRRRFRDSQSNNASGRRCAGQRCGAAAEIVIPTRPVPACPPAPLAPDSLACRSPWAEPLGAACGTAIASTQA